MIDSSGFAPREIVEVEIPEVGRLLTDNEDYEYRRLTVEDPVSTILRDTGIETEIAKKAFVSFLKCLKLLDEKQKMYGMSNIEWLGEYGINLRVGEKAARIKYLMDQKFNPDTESLEDSWMDIVNLALIGYMKHNNLWK